MTPATETYRVRARSRGSALLSAIALAAILALLAAAAASSMLSWQTLLMSKEQVQAAGNLAQAGIDSELNYISKQVRAGAAVTSHTNQMLPGQPFPGAPGSIAGMPGQYWVYTADPSNPALPWSGTPTFQITCVAEVGGQIKAGQLTGGALKTVNITGTATGLFSLYAAYAGMPGNSSGTASLSVIGGSAINIGGPTACNGIVLSPAGALTCQSTVNGASQNAYNLGHQFPIVSAQNNPNQIAFPKVPNLIRYTFSQTAAMTDVQAWAWLQTHAANGSILTYKSGLPSNAKLIPANVQSANFAATKTTISNLPSGTSGDWANAKPVPGSTNTALIFPPGDYYFTSSQIATNTKTQIIFDNAGLSVGGNPNHMPIRIWFNGAAGQSDTISVPLTFTNTADTTTFRIYYGTNGSNLSVGTPAAKLAIEGSLYAISGGALGATLSFAGGATVGTALDLNGAVLADRLAFSGHCILTPPQDNGNAQDYKVGVGYTGGYTG